MRFDFHTHIGPFEADRPAQDLVAMLDEHALDRAVTFPSRGLHASPAMYARANDYVAEAMVRYPDRLTGFCSVNPWHREEAVAEFERSVQQLGLRGLKLHPPTQGFDVFDLSLMVPIMETAGRLGVPVAIHGGIREHDNPLRFYLLSDLFPNVALIMLHANFGGVDRVAIKWAAEHTRNLYFETSATAEPAFIAALAGWASSNRILYGSDWPWIPPRLMMAIVEYSGLSEQAVADILGRNADRLLRVAATG
jgi:predicted TIM-barrel fold metal-dependent hydrolase